MQRLFLRRLSRSEYEDSSPEALEKEVNDFLRQHPDSALCHSEVMPLEGGEMMILLELDQRPREAVCPICLEDYECDVQEETMALDAASEGPDPA